MEIFAFTKEQVTKELRPALGIVVFILGIVYVIAKYSVSQKTHDEFLANCRANYSDIIGLANCMEQFELGKSYYPVVSGVALVLIVIAVLLFVATFIYKNRFAP